MTNSSSVFDFDALNTVCSAHEDDFEHMYDMDRYEVAQTAPDNFYLFSDRGSAILAVAHLDTVGASWERDAVLASTAGGDVVYSRALDDRLGAYVILEMLPALGIEFDVLLTVGEESGRSTAAFFDTDKTYDWIIEFDRGGTDVVLYQYEDADMIERVESSGARVGEGIFSDISYMEHLHTKAINWGVGYRDYHGPRAHVWLDDLFTMIDHFLVFHETYAGVRMEHTPSERDWWMGGYSTRWSDDTECGEYGWGDCGGEIVDRGELGLMCDEHMRAWDSLVAEDEGAEA